MPFVIVAGKWLHYKDNSWWKRNQVLTAQQGNWDFSITLIPVFPGTFANSNLPHPFLHWCFRLISIGCSCLHWLLIDMILGFHSFSPLTRKIFNVLDNLPQVCFWEDLPARYPAIGSWDRLVYLNRWNLKLGFTNGELSSCRRHWRQNKSDTIPSTLLFVVRIYLLNFQPKAKAKAKAILAKPLYMISCAVLNFLIRNALFNS